MILTVTLNAAIDRTVAVPNFRLGQRHRAVEARTVAGGKGVNVARALKLLGQPVIATGLAGGPTGDADPRAARRGVDPQRLHPDPRRVADQPRRDRPDLGRADRDQRARPGGQRRRGRPFVDKLLYLAQGADFCVIAGSVPPGVDAGRLRAADRRAAPPRRPMLLDSDGEPMRAGLRAGPAVVAPNVAEAEEAVGHEFNEPDDLVLGLRELIEMGAGEAIITRDRGCVAIVGEPSSAALRGRDRAARADRDGRLGRRLPRRLRRRALRRRLAARLPRLRRRLRRRVDAALRRRHDRPARGRAAARPRRGPRARRPGGVA